MLARLAALVMLILLGSAAWLSAQLFRAELLFCRNTLASVEHAARISPDWAECHTRLAALDGPARASSHLRHAVNSNPRDSRAWVELGLLAESSGAAAEAEKCLLQAARYDKQFDPAWSLANFYFRQSEQGAAAPSGAGESLLPPRFARREFPENTLVTGPRKFWHWAHAAASMSYSDLTPLFRLCFLMTGDTGQILDQVVVPVRRVEHNYLDFLLVTGRLAAAGPAARRIIASAGPDDAATLLTDVDFQLRAGNRDEALWLWNALVDRKLVAGKPLDPPRGVALTNPDFSHPPLASGFDWRPLAVDGIVHSAGENAFHLSFSGKQPETCRLLAQYLPLDPDSAYRLRFEYRTSGMSGTTGLGWLLDPTADGESSTVLQESPSVSPSDDWRTMEWTFHSPASRRLARLVLFYHRALGTTRLEGTLLLRKVQLTFLHH